MSYPNSRIEDNEGMTPEDYKNESQKIIDEQVERYLQSEIDLLNEVFADLASFRYEECSDEEFSSKPEYEATWGVEFTPQLDPLRKYENGHHGENPSWKKWLMKTINKFI